MQVPIIINLPLPHPCTPRPPQLLSNLTHLQIQHPFNIPRQLRIIPIPRHVRLQIPTPPPSTVPKQRNVRRSMSARRPVNARFLTQATRQISREFVVLQDEIDIGVRQVAKAVAGQDGVFEVRALVGAIERLPESFGVLGGHACALEGQGIEAVEGQAAAFVVCGGEHHGVGVLVDPFADEFHYVVVHDCFVQVAHGVVGVACVVDS